MKRIISFMLIMCIVFSCFAAFAVSAGAESIEKTAQVMENGEKYTFSEKDFYKVGKYQEHAKDFKITTVENGELKLKMVFKYEWTIVKVLDTKGNEMPAKSVTVDYGENVHADNGVSAQWDANAEKFSATAVYKLEKGTYYIRVSLAGIGDYLFQFVEGDFQLSPTFPAPEAAKISAMSLSLTKGTSVQFGALLSAATDEAVKWSSSDKTVAAVTSKGKVTAKAAGTAWITAKIGSSTVRIKIKVT